MAYDNLQPHQAFIISQRTAGKTLVQLAEHLSNELGVETTAGTLSRYLKTLDVADAPPARETSQSEERLIELAALIIEQGHEQREQTEMIRLAVEHVAGKTGGLGSRITALEELVRSTACVAGERGAAVPVSGQIDNGMIAKIWGRAFLWISMLWFVAAGSAGAAMWWFLRG